MKYMPQLDAIRAIAVLLVMISHFIPGSSAIAPLGGIGVRLFFVLSGFLITGILLAARERPLADALRVFYARRFLRIFPLFYFALFVSFVLDFGAVRDTIWWHVTYLSNFLLYSRHEFLGAVTHFWSLAVEEQFYLVWPLIVLLTPMRALPLAIAAMVLLAPVTMLIADDPMASVLPISNLDALGFGALLAVPQSRRFVASAGLWIGVPLFTVTVIMRWLGIGGFVRDVVLGFMLPLASAWLISGAAKGFAGLGRAVFEWRPLTYLGRISYGVYVYHALMPYFLKRLFPIWTYTTAAQFVILVAATIALAALSYRFLEQPFLALKDRLPAATGIDASRRHLPVQALNG